MKVTVIGTGYVGLVTGVGLASKGHKVICVDVIQEKVDQINQGITPIYEKDLDNLLKEVIEKETLQATTDIKRAILSSELSMICVGTPTADDGSIDLTYIKKVSEDVGQALKEKNDYHVVTVKSTVVPGTTRDVILPLLEHHSAKKAGEGFGLGVNPEFLREGLAIQDFLQPG